MAEARRPLIAGNWKMNGLPDDAGALAKAVAAGAGGVADKAELAVCPPFPLLGLVGEAVSGAGVALGAQDCHAAENGAHTGDVSPALLAAMGCRYVILGHSERRTDHRESDGEVRAKVEGAHAAGLSTIVCIGETEEERDEGRTLTVVYSQLSTSLPGGVDAANTVIAYEPVWAIGTGRTPTNEQVQEVHAAIRSALAERFGQETADGIRILYGGSMKPANAAELVALADVDGGLIGGASLKAEDFLAIAGSCP